MKAFVTGGHGFIGSHLVQKLVDQKHDVTILTRDTADLWRVKDLLPRIQQISGDLRSKEEMQTCIRSVQPDVVFHLAVSNMQSGVRASNEEVIDSNLLGTLNLLEAVQQESSAAFIQTGSFLEYGKKDAPMKETDLCNPGELYSITKLASTLLAQSLGSTESKPALTFRVFTPFGPGMQKGRLVEQIITRALRGEDILLTEPTITRDCIYAPDLAELLIQGMEKAAQFPGQIFNAGGGKAITLDTLVQTVLTLTGSKSQVRWHALPTVAYDTTLCQADMEKTFSAFPWRPAHDVTAGLQATIDWYRSHPLL